MAWNYLLIQEFALDEQTLPGYVACLHTAHPRELSSIDDIFSVPWEQGGDEVSVKIQFKPVDVDGVREYHFIRTYACNVHPLLLPREEMFHRTLGECGQRKAKEMALGFILDEVSQDSYRNLLIRPAGSDTWVPHGMT